MFINDMFGDEFDKRIAKIKEDSWSDGQNQWSSEHDQWANESAPAGQFNSKQEVIAHFVKNGKSAAAGASAWERGWRGNTPKAKKPTGPVRSYHDDLDDKRFMSDEGMEEGYQVVPGIDRERYGERPGLEGPFHTKSGKVVYYDKREGKYYDPDSDFYISHDDWQAMNEQGVAEGLNDTQKKIEDTINKLEDRLKHAKSDEQWDRISARIERLQAGLKRSKQGVAEGRVDSPVSHAITRRLLDRHHGFIVKYDPSTVMNAVDIVADWNKGVKDFTPEQVSEWTQQVIRYIQTGAGIGLEEAEGDPEGLPHLTKDLASHISQQIDTEGPHAVEKSIEWGDGAADELLSKIKDMLDDYAGTVEETAAWQKKYGKNKNGGLNQKGVDSYRKEHPGSKLQTAVTTKPSKLKKGSKAANRRKSFCARMGGMKGPMKDEHGKPTRKALALRKWNCESVEQFEQMIESYFEQAEMLTESVKQRLDKSCWKGYHKAGTKIKGGTRVNNCVPNKVNEVSKDTLKNYIKGNAEDQVQRASSDSFVSGSKGDKYNKADVTAKDVRRQKGMDRALNKLTKEEAGFDTTDSASPVGGHINENGNASDVVYGAIIRRIIGGHRSLISKYGIDAIEEAAREIADWNSDVEEIGTSDVSGWVRQVFQSLSGSVPINELSNDTLGQYKAAAGKAASAADKAGDYAKGNKRFKGIVKATNKQFANDTKKI